MSRPTTGKEFLDLLGRSHLIEESLLEKLRPQIQEQLGDGARRPESVARALAKNHVITPYQAIQLLAGRYRGFYIAKYKFLELLGAGGMGKVYLAEELDSDRLVAIKVVRRNFKDEASKTETLKRFHREAHAVASLDHDNIIRAYDYNQDNGVPYIAMEYVEGIDAGQQVIQYGALPWKQVADYAVQSAAALHNAHESDMVHRDVKPQNLLVSTTGKIKLLDLGLVASFDGSQDDSLTSADNQLGTVDYISPEQALDSHGVDPRADIYSLGASLYSLLCAKVLFPGKSTAQKMLLHQTTMPQPIQELVPDLPPEMAAIITKMLAKSPDDRFPSMVEVEAAFAPFAERKNPPFEAEAVKYPIQTFKNYLGRSPSASSVSLVTMGQAAKPTTQTDAEKKDEAASAITTSSPEPEPEFEDLFGVELSSIGDFELPSRSRRRKKGGSSSRKLKSKSKNRKKTSSKKKSDNARNAITMIASSCIIVIAVGLVIMQLSSDKQPLINRVEDRFVENKTPVKPTKPTTTKKNVKPTPKKPKKPTKLTKPTKPKTTPTKPKTTPPKPKTTPPKKGTPPAKKPPVIVKNNPQPTWESVLAFQEKIQADQETVYYGAFTQKPMTKKANKVTNSWFPNESSNGSNTGVSLFLHGNAKWEAKTGRFPDKKGAIRFIPNRNRKSMSVAALPSQHLSQFNYQNGFSIGFWVRVSKPRHSQMLVDRGPNHWSILQTRPGKIIWSVNRPNTTKYVRVESKMKVIDQNWHYIVCTYESPATRKSRLTLYIDGRQEGTAEGAWIKTKTTPPITFGLSQDVKERRPLDGFLDSFLLINRPLPENEVKEFYNKTRTAKMPSVPMEAKTVVDFGAEK